MMKPWQETDPFLADFGEDASVNGKHFMAILDEPQDTVDIETGVVIQSDEFTMRFATNDVKISRNDTICYCGRRFIAREWPRRLGDGAFSLVKLSEVIENE